MISRFKGEYAFLSNFYPSPIKVTEKGGEPVIVYPTVEHAYQAAKTNDAKTKRLIAAKDTPGKAKRAGGKRGIIRDLDQDVWESKKLPVMLSLIIAKFSNPVLGKQLLATGDEELVEGNNWNDTFWGVCRGQGQNHLGKILMQVRLDLQFDQS
jgi:ribA/ribD-fused uncharacterized protein